MCFFLLFSLLQLECSESIENSEFAYFLWTQTFLRFYAQQEKFPAIANKGESKCTCTYACHGCCFHRQINLCESKSEKSSRRKFTYELFHNFRLLGFWYIVFQLVIWNNSYVRKEPLHACVKSQELIEQFLMICEFYQEPFPATWITNYSLL